ncbi:MAG TPA: hypothetical protein VGQ46_04150 [Thermoanaerobaculia bacterium]|jgi:hypothetical protein|nr:hypothetical protein [Thermoanaerobaculia bacterium]
MNLPSTHPRLYRLVITAGFVFVAAIHIGVITGLIDRIPHVDETEQLQGSIMLARGERMYTDFAEHHPPFFFELLSAFAPTSDDEPALNRYLIRARALSGVFGTIAFAAAAWVLWKASGRAYTVLIFIALLLSRPVLWGRAFAEVRSEPPSLALWWAGAALILLPRESSRRHAVLRGLGLGLVAQACLWNPKWPVASVVIGVIFLLNVRRTRHAVTAVSTAVAVVAAGLAIVAMTTGLRAFFDHTFGFTRALVQWSRAVQAASPRSAIAWLHCPDLFRLIYAAPAAAIVAFGVWWRRDAVRDVPLLWSMLALAAAALIEIRFVYPYPALWLQYFIFWSILAAMMMALVPQICFAFVERFTPAVTKPAATIVTLLALVAATNALPANWDTSDPYRVSSAYLRARLGPRDTVWIDMARYPLGAHRASYYWFGFRDVVPAAMRYAQTRQGAAILPAIREEDLPPCRLERGREPNLRFIAARLHYERLPTVAGCFDRLLAARRIAPTPFSDVYAVVRSAPR